MTSQKTAAKGTTTKSTAEKTSLKNKHLRTGDYFVINAFSSHSILCTSYATGGPDRSAAELNKENERFTGRCSRFDR